MTVLRRFAAKGRTLLVLGLVAGVAFPEVGRALRPWLAEMVAGLLFLGALRVDRFSAAGGLRSSLRFVMIAQLAIPVALASSFHALGWAGPIAASIVLLCAACTISGAPNIVVLCGHAPDHALRNLVVGAVLLPLTVLPVLAIWPPLAGAWAELASAAGRLLVLIALAGAAALAVRRFVDVRTERFASSTDAASGLLMAVLVVALMSAIPSAWRTDPYGLTTTLLAAVAANVLLQLIGYAAWRRAAPAARVAAAVGMGNRNMALFLAALPASTMEPLLLFIACYQIPMYLTPIVFARLYARPLEALRLEG